jgi:hypothetical protein
LECVWTHLPYQPVVSEPDSFSFDVQDGRVGAHRAMFQLGPRGHNRRDQTLPLKANFPGNLADAPAQLRGTRFELDEHVQIGVGRGVASGPRAEHAQVEDRRNVRQATLKFAHNLPLCFAQHFVFLVGNSFAQRARTWLPGDHGRPFALLKCIVPQKPGRGKEAMANSRADDRPGNHDLARFVFRSCSITQLTHHTTTAAFLIGISTGPTRLTLYRNRLGWIKLPKCCGFGLAYVLKETDTLKSS